MKLRIIVGNSHGYPYRLQVKRSKWSIFWKDVSIHNNLKDAEFSMKYFTLPPKPGTVIAIYTDKDRLVDKLKG